MSDNNALKLLCASENSTIRELAKALTETIPGLADACELLNKHRYSDSFTELSNLLGAGRNRESTITVLNGTEVVLDSCVIFVLDQTRRQLRSELHSAQRGIEQLFADEKKVQITLLERGLIYQKPIAFDILVLSNALPVLTRRVDNVLRSEGSFNSRSEFTNRDETAVFRCYEALRDLASSQRKGLGGFSPLSESPLHWAHAKMPALSDFPRLVGVSEEQAVADLTGAFHQLVALSEKFRHGHVLNELRKDAVDSAFDRYDRERHRLEELLLNGYISLMSLSDIYDKSKAIIDSLETRLGEKLQKAHKEDDARPIVNLFADYSYLIGARKLQEGAGKAMSSEFARACRSLIPTLWDTLRREGGVGNRYPEISKR